MECPSTLRPVRSGRFPEVVFDDIAGPDELGGLAQQWINQSLNHWDHDGQRRIRRRFGGPEIHYDRLPIARVDLHGSTESGLVGVDGVELVDLLGATRSLLRVIEEFSY